MHTLFTQYLNRTIDVTEEQLAYIVGHFKPKTTKRNEILLAKGELCHHCYFVERGYLRMYYTGDDGHESTRFLAFEGDLGTALASFISQKPAPDFMQTDEPSELLCITYANFQQLLREVPEMETVYRLNLEKTLLIHTQRLEGFLTMDAKDRYEHLLQTNPMIVQRLTNKIVASYLGITQETLSRLKASK